MKKLIPISTFIFAITLYSCQPSFKEFESSSVRCYDDKHYCEKFVEMQDIPITQAGIKKAADEYLIGKYSEKTDYKEFRVFFYDKSKSEIKDIVRLENLLYEVAYLNYGKKIRFYDYKNGIRQH